MRSKIQPGPLLAAAVLIAALLALALIDAGGGGGPGALPKANDGPAVLLLPRGRDAGAAQYGYRRHHGDTLQGRRGPPHVTR